MKERTSTQIMLSLLNRELKRLERNLEKIKQIQVPPNHQELIDLQNELLVTNGKTRKEIAFKILEMEDAFDKWASLDFLEVLEKEDALRQEIKKVKRLINSVDYIAANAKPFRLFEV